jgi:hypothetical protein
MSLLILASCTTCVISCTNAYDAEKAAAQYCDCMRKHRAADDFGRASKVCDAKIISENRYVKLWTVDMRDRELDRKFSDETRDSIKAFVSSFRQYTSTNCCRETLGCKDSRKVY